ncbi:hypothetical protein C2W62_33765 [Candidatus Entotheonella serta]|nr:hypothetical protein C2W62_33765 [Candidatus Entotheonella serta]
MKERKFERQISKRALKAMTKTVAKGKRVVLKIYPGSCRLGDDGISQIRDLRITNPAPTG